MFFFYFRINEHSPVAFRFIHRIKKRSTGPTDDSCEITRHIKNNNNKCLRTLVPYKKYDCKDFVTGRNSM